MPLGVSTRMAGRVSVVSSNTIRTDDADEDTAEAVGVDGAEGYDCSRSTNAVDTSVNGVRQAIENVSGGTTYIQQEICIAGSRDCKTGG